MRVSYSSYIVRSEWTWLLAVSTLLLTLTTLPVVIMALLLATHPTLEFMGATHHPSLVAADLSRMAQGRDGQLLTLFRHTPEPHRALFVQPLYPVLGSIAAFTGLPNVLIYHVGRVLATLFMTVALYHLGAHIWVKVRARRIFLVLAWLGGGVGLFWALIDPTARPLDLGLPMAYPYYAALVSIHYPLAIGVIALLAAVCIAVLRPGFQQSPTAQNGGVTIAMSSLALAVLYPPALLPLMGAFTLCVMLDWLWRRKLALHEWRWLLWGIVPALPVTAYLSAMFTSNPVVSIWLSQDYYPTYDIPAILVSCSLLLIAGAPALWRAVRSFERDVDRFMLFWLIALMVLGAFAPRFASHFLIGLTLPLAYFATRSLDHVWLEHIRRSWHRRVYVVALLPLMISPIVVAYGSVALAIASPQPSRVALPTDYRHALRWIDGQTPNNAVILAAPAVSTWIPVLSQHRVVYGHPTETMFAAARRHNVLQWYRADDRAACRPLAQPQWSIIGSFYVEYALVGPLELALGDAQCADQWELVHEVGSVQIYQCDLACRTGSR